jgi:hypothetical protein
MADLRGRPLAYVGLIIALWTGARWTYVPQLAQKTSGATGYESIGAARPASTLSDASAQSLPQIQSKHRHRDSSSSPAWRASAASARRGIISHRLPPAMDPWQDGGRPFGLLESPRLVPDDNKPLSAGRDTPPTIAVALVGKAGQPPLLRHKPFDIYSYSFWRFSTGGKNTLAPGAQYGGSQSGIIMTYHLLGDDRQKPALLLRASTTPDGQQSEAAVGLRWKPRAVWPITLSAEHRLRRNASDALAFYVAGGVDERPAAKGWTLQAFGQGGYVAGRDGGGFFDAQARLARPLTTTERLPISVGVGGWAGGQRGAARLDLGPMTSTRIDAGGVPITVQADWRMRVAGDAVPKNSATLTLSAGF